jgi:hypothetical protein
MTDILRTINLSKRFRKTVALDHLNMIVAGIIPVSQDFTFSIARMAPSEATVDTVAPLAYIQRNFEIQNLRLGDFQLDAAPVPP